MTGNVFRLGGWTSGAARCLAVVVCVLMFAGRAVAAPNDIIQGHVLSLGIGGQNGEGGLYRAGAWVPVRVRLENRSGKEFVGRLGVEQLDLDGDKVLSVGQKVVLDATNVQGRDFWVYYWPRPDDDLHGATSVVVLDESGSQVVSTIPVPMDKNGEGKAVGLGKKDDTNDRSYRWVVILGPRPVGFASYYQSYGGTESVRFSWVERAEDLPDNVLGLDGVDTVVWEADKVRPSDVPADFQMKALMAWVRAGGHLIVSVSTQGQEFLKAGSALRDAMPITFTGLRELKMEDLGRFAGCAPLSGDTVGITQATGTLRADARPINGGTVEPFGKNPLAVEGVYGQGAVTVVTVDVTNPEMEQRLSEHQWMDFWNQVAGWEGNQRQLMTRAEYDEAQKNSTNKEPPVTLPPSEVHIGDNIPQLVDVRQETQIRILVAVLFLLVYWLLAGPIGHLVLKLNKVVHWSWWVFGGTVLVATGIAAGVVFFLELTNYDLRHRSFVLGTVNSKEATVVGYYGVFAPKSGLLAVTQPESPDAGGGGGGMSMNYLVPMCMPTVEPVKPFADPQSYELFDEKANSASPVFRDTLKKMQGRWRGSMNGIDGTYKLVTEEPVHFEGKLTNHSGYALSHVQFVLHAPPPSAFSQGASYLFRLDGVWPKGGTIDLAKDLKMERQSVADGQPANGPPVMLESLLNALAHTYADTGGITGHAASGLDDQQQKLAKGRSEDLLYLLLNARAQDPLDDPAGVRVEPVRPFARTTDCTKELYAAGALIVARSGDLGMESRKNYVPSPVPLSVNGKVVPGEGDVIFAWAMPLQQRVPEGLLSRGLLGNQPQSSPKKQTQEGQ